MNKRAIVKSTTFLVKLKYIKRSPCGSMGDLSVILLRQISRYIGETIWSKFMKIKICNVVYMALPSMKNEKMLWKRQKCAKYSKRNFFIDSNVLHGKDRRILMMLLCKYIRIIHSHVFFSSRFCKIIQCKLTVESYSTLYSNMCMVWPVFYWSRAT
jgi:hypothetical protein